MWGRPSAPFSMNLDQNIRGRLQQYRIVWCETARFQRWIRRIRSSVFGSTQCPPVEPSSVKVVCKRLHSSFYSGPGSEACIPAPLCQRIIQCGAPAVWFSQWIGPASRTSVALPQSGPLPLPCIDIDSRRDPARPAALHTACVLTAAVDDRSRVWDRTQPQRLCVLRLTTEDE